MDATTLINLAPRLPANISVLIRGDTGIGKSYITKGIANTLKIPLIDVRGSTMDESKVTGIPDFLASKELGVSTFVLPSWFVRACKEPCLLFLDELNRSMPQVQQAFFQVVLDRSLGNDSRGVPMQLHPQTRVYAAVNVGTAYDVNDMDPALLRRFWVVDLDTTLEDWMIFAKNVGIDPLMMEFLKQNPSHFKVNPGSVTPGTVCPYGASWHRADETLKHMGLAPSDHMGERPPGIYETLNGFVGSEASISFVEFIARYQKLIKIEDIFAGKIPESRVKKLPASEILTVIDKIQNWAEKKNEKDEFINCWDNTTTDIVINKFIKHLAQEQQIHFWNAIAKTKNLGMICMIHPRMGKEMVDLVKKAQELSKKTAT